MTVAGGAGVVMQRLTVASRSCNAAPSATMERLPALTALQWRARRRCNGALAGAPDAVMERSLAASEL